MYIQVIAIAAEELSMDERQIVCDECAAVCARLAGVQAHQWSVNHTTNTICGTMKWTAYEAIAMGTESLCRDVAFLQSADRILRCREIACPASRRPVRQDTGTKPNTGFVQYPPDYDPRG
jgi:hypothetical protein